MEQVNDEFVSQGISKILLNIKEKRLSKLEPSFDPEIGVYYESLKGFAITDQLQVLKVLKDEGIAIKKPIGSVLCCSNRDGYKFYNNYVCNFCKSINMTRGQVIRHIPCNNVDFDYNFLRPDGVLMCRKCNKKLIAIGVDYLRQGNFFKCITCDSMLPETELRYTCVRCNKYHTVDDLKVVSMSSYDVDLTRLATFCRESDYLLSVVDELKKAGMISAHLELLMGKSTVSHPFALVIYRTRKDIGVQDGSAIAAIDFLDQSINNQSTILAEITKFIDVTAEKKILVVIPRLNDVGRSLAIEYGIHLIESGTRSEAKTQLIQLILNDIQGQVSPSTPAGKTKAEHN